MKKHWILIYLALAGLLLAGCRSATEAPGQSGEAAGADWRTWGWVQDAGTVIHDGEQTDVLVCVNTDCIDLYYDDDTQTLYARLRCPAPLDNAQSAYQSISFADQNGDGASDAQVSFVQGDGTETVFLWYWDADAGFVSQESAPNAQK